MTCYHPMRAIKFIKDGKVKYNVKATKFMPKTWYERNKDLWIEIPCGKCIGCRLAYSRQWANRCVIEAKDHEFNEFITLTYDEEHLPKVKGCTKDGEITNVGTLVPDDLKKFIKDLRRYYKYHFNHDGIRFFACGEYGTKNDRPHFHLLCFNLPLPDKEFLFHNFNRNAFYTSEIITKIWGKGLAVTGDVTWETAAYTARYITKKVKGPAAENYYKTRGIVPEFTRMSRDPGIARNYYEENKNKIYETDEIILTNSKGQAQIIKPGKYYDRLFDLDSPEAMAAIREHRIQIIKEAMAQEMAKTDKTREEYLETKESAKIAQIKKLKRAAI